MNRDKTNTDEQELLSALRTLAREEEGLGTPPRVEGRLMRAFDATRTVRSRHQRMFAGHALKAAAVFVLLQVADLGLINLAAKNLVFVPLLYVAIALPIVIPLFILLYDPALRPLALIRRRAGAAGLP